MAQTTEEIITQGTKVWGIILLYVLAGKACVTFPGATRSKPSYRVHVALGLTGLYRESDRKHFPVEVHWKIWNEQILPVLGDPSLQLTVPVNKARLCPSQIDDLICQYAGMVEAQFRNNGVLPLPP
jgi:hypothetical protein